MTTYIDKIQNLLQQMEKDKDIKIIFAIENGDDNSGLGCFRLLRFPK